MAKKEDSVISYVLFVSPRVCLYGGETAECGWKTERQQMGKETKMAKTKTLQGGKVRPERDWWNTCQTRRKRGKIAKNLRGEDRGRMKESSHLNKTHVVLTRPRVHKPRSYSQDAVWPSNDPSGPLSRSVWVIAGIVTHRTCGPEHCWHVVRRCANAPTHGKMSQMLAQSLASTKSLQGRVCHSGSSVLEIVQWRHSLVWTGAVCWRSRYFLMPC